MGNVVYDRKWLAKFAQRAATKLDAEAPDGFRIVIAVTDESGDWVGVGSNTTPEDVDAILASAVDKSGREYYTRKARAKGGG